MKIKSLELNPELSVVTCVYKSEKYLDEFLDQCIKVTKDCGFEKVEYIFVIDGISDNSLGLLVQKQHLIPNIKIIELSRNFGHHYAASAGLKAASGDLIFLIDCDLEVSPNVLKDFYSELNNEQADVIYGIQRTRKGHFLEKVLGGIFWILFNWLSGTKVPKNIVTERLMRRYYLDALNSMGDKNLFMAGMMYWVGFNQKGIIVDKKQRVGKSTYGILKRLSLFIQAITNFSDRPLVYIFQFGIIITFMSIFFAMYFILLKIIDPSSVFSGYASIISAIFLSLGILTSSLGIVGLYLSKIFIQVQNRPTYIIKKIIENDK